jgi:hypothetical protein
MTSRCWAAESYEIDTLIHLIYVASEATKCFKRGSILRLPESASFKNQRGLLK